MENIVAQMLRQSGHKLYFYSRSDSTNRKNHMEIDFLITQGKKNITCGSEIRKLSLSILPSISSERNFHPR